MRMAVNATPLSSTLVVRYQSGTTPAGGPEIRQKSLNDVKADATEQDVYDVAAALFSLGQHPVINVLLKKNFELLNQ
ncbi:DUF1659 domain-containing protein [Desulfitobacterium sp. AusDCA]